MNFNTVQRIICSHGLLFLSTYPWLLLGRWRWTMAFNEINLVSKRYLTLKYKKYYEE